MFNSRFSSKYQMTCESYSHYISKKTIRQKTHPQSTLNYKVSLRKFKTCEGQSEHFDTLFWLISHLIEYIINMYTI